MATLVSKLTATPSSPVTYNVGMAETFSWVPVEGAGRPLFARASYIANFEDLSISLSAAELHVSSIEIKDGNSNRVADVEDAGGGLNALRVLTQDLEAINDSVTIGDSSGNFASIDNSLSALRIIEVSPVTAVRVLNPVTVSGSVTVSNLISSVSVTNPVTQLSATILNPSFTVLNPISSVSLTNQISSLSITNPITAVNILNTVAVSGSLTVINPITAVSITNQLTGITVTNLMSSVTLTNQISSFSITNPVTALSINNTVSISGEITLTNQISAFTVLNPITAVDILNTVAVSLTNQLTSFTVTNPTTAVSILNALSSTILNPITAVEILNTVAVSGFVTITNPISSVSLVNQLTATTVLNPITAVSLLNQLSSFTILNPITAVDILNTVAVSGSVTVSGEVSATILNPVTAVSITNPITAVDILNTIAVSGSVTITNPTTGVQVFNPIALKDLDNNNVTVTAATSSLNVNVTNPIVATIDPSGGFPVTFTPSPNFDAFGRLRTSSPLTLFDSSHRYRDNNLWSSLTAVGSNHSFNQNQGLIDMTVNSLSGSSVIRETTKVFSYQSGKSLQVMNTLVMASSATNLLQRVGYFGQDNGIYVQLEDDILSFVKRTIVNGLPASNIVIPQSSWNGDKLDGTGSSGFTLDITKAQIFWMDIEWLGVGTVRMGFIINGQFIVCHSFHHANLISSTYITTASLPLRYEITNKGATSGSHTLKQICSTVISEGGYDMRGLQQAASIPINAPRTFAAANTYYPIISIRLKTTPNRLDAIVIMTALSILGDGDNKNYNWRVISSGTTTGGTWVDAGIDSAVEYNITGTSFTSGRILASGYVSSTNQSSPSIDILKEALFKFQLERNSFTSTPYELTLVAGVNNSGGTTAMFASMDWEEVSR